MAGSMLLRSFSGFGSTLTVPSSSCLDEMKRWGTGGWPVTVAEDVSVDGYIPDHGLIS